MSGTIIALMIYLVTGLAAVPFGREASRSGWIGALGCVAAAAVGLPEVLTVLATGVGWNIAIPWSSVPGASLHLGLDGLSAVFLVPMFLLTALVGIACKDYFESHRGSISPGLAWLALNLTAGAMLGVALARNAVLFLIAWEVMAVAGYVLVIYHAEQPETRPAGWKWLVASQLGATCLLPVFVVLGRAEGSLEFDRFSVEGLSPTVIGVLFVLAVIGFGAKAGIVPFHVWLPEAHPVAPSPVSAMLSGVLIKFGIYGLIRVLGYLGSPQEWWAWALIALGLASGIWGILNAVVQKDLKQLLAYSSVENIGIIIVGIGLGLYGRYAGSTAMAVLGFGGALLHVWTHAAGKGLLFLGAGAVKHAAGTTDIDRLGGLLKQVPVLGTCSVIGAASICALPPLAGFTGEFLIYLAAFEEEMAAGGLAALPPLAVLTMLSLIGGLAIYAFAKAAGLTLLGAPRDPAITLTPVPLSTLGPIVVLAGVCGVLGLASPVLLSELSPALMQATGAGAAEVGEATGQAASMLAVVGVVCVVFLLLTGALTALRHGLLSRREVGETVTWDCGYAAPTARMQYTGSSFGQSIADLAGTAVGHERGKPETLPYFPGPNVSLETSTEDVAESHGYRLVFGVLSAALRRGRALQGGRVHLYVMYIMVTLIAVLLWYAGVWG